MITIAMMHLLMIPLAYLVEIFPSLKQVLEFIAQIIVELNPII